MLRVRRPARSNVFTSSRTPAARGSASSLVETLLREARGIGYRELKLDTLDRMTGARRLYQRLGFAVCPPYYHNPLPDAVYMTLTL